MMASTWRFEREMRIGDVSFSSDQASADGLEHGVPQIYETPELPDRIHWTLWISFWWHLLAFPYSD